MGLVELLNVVFFVPLIMGQDAHPAKVHEQLHHDDQIRLIQTYPVSRPHHVRQEVNRQLAIDRVAEARLYDHTVLGDGLDGRLDKGKGGTLTLQGSLKCVSIRGEASFLMSSSVAGHITDMGSIR